MKTKSVSDKIAEHFKPKRLVTSDSEDEDTKVKLSESLSNIKSGRVTASDIFKRNAPLLQDLDKKYQGKVSSRNISESEEDSDEENSENEDEKSDEEEDLDEEQIEESEDDDDEEEEDNDVGISDFINQFKTNIQKKDGTELDSEEDETNPMNVDDVSDSESGDEEDDNSDYSDGNEEDDDIEDDLDEEQSEDEEEEDLSSKEGEEKEERSLEFMKPAQEDNVKKGQAVRNQLKLWERILETRIRSQAMLNKANSLPEGELLSKFSKSSEEFQTLQKQTTKNVANLLDGLVNLQNSLLSQYNETKSILKSGLYKRKTESKSEIPPKKLCLEFQGDSTYESFKTYRNSVIQKWSDRTKITNARNSKEMSLNHSVLNQIDAVLLKKSDLIKNSQTVKGTYKLFKSKSSPVEDEEEQVQISSEVYDDTDFYHQILRELIEYKSNSSTNPVEAARNFAEFQKFKNKIKKPVDQKASKGRKIRYVIHKKITNFMAPYSESNWTEDAVSELFASLFGKYGSSSNNKSKETDSNHEIERENEIKIL